jgi:hypothetical protein
LFLKVNLALVRERATSGDWINFVVFDASSPSGSVSDNSVLLAQLTAKARASSIEVDQTALAFASRGRLRFFGSRALIDILSEKGLPAWTHEIDV